MKTLGVSESSNVSNYSQKDPVNNAIRNYENHSSVKKIHETITVTSNFHFKVGTFKDIPTKGLKVTPDICSPFLAAIWNQELILNKKFPQKLKLADIIPVYKKEDSTKVINYRPVSVLPTVSKIFEQWMQKQLSEYINQFLPLFLCGYRKGFSTQTASVWLIEKWKHQFDKNGFVGAVLMDLSKALDTINYDLLIAKLHAYGFGKNALDLVYSYLNNRNQRVKINTTFSTWTDLVNGVFIVINGKNYNLRSQSDF